MLSRPQNYNLLIILIGYLIVYPSLGFTQSIQPLFKEAQTQKSANLDKMISSYQLVELNNNKATRKANNNDQIELLTGLGSVTTAAIYTDNLVHDIEALQKVQFLGGTTKGGGQINLTIAENFAMGFIDEGGVRTYIQPLRYFDKNAEPSAHVVYKEADIKNDHAHHSCGHSLVPEKLQINDKQLSKASSQGCSVMDIGIANAHDMLQKYGSTQEVLNHNAALLSMCQSDYRSEFTKNIEFKFVTHYIAASAAQDPFSKNRTSNDAGLLLPAFRDWAGTDFFGYPDGLNGGFEAEFDIAVMWTARDLTQSGNNIIGLAYTPGWFSTLEDYTPAISRLRTLMSHETGHNFSAAHDSDGSFIMSPSSTGSDVWSSVSVNKISNYINALDFMDECASLGSPNAHMFQSSFAICKGSSVQFEDQSQYGENRVWNFSNGSSSTEAKPTVIFNQEGFQVVTVTSSNAAGDDSYSSYVNVQNEPKLIVRQMAAEAQEVLVIYP